jgi:hypothetical protein
MEMWVGLKWLKWDAGFLERSNKVSGPVKGEKFLDSLNGYELVWKDSDVRGVWECEERFTHYLFVILIFLKTLIT